MSRTRFLLLLRHGKSDWSADYGEDHERPLARRGEEAARVVGRFLSRAGLAPDSVITSTAVRARATVELAAQAGGWSCPVRLSGRLYGTSPATVLEEIEREPDATRVLLVAGHEPTWSALAGGLAGGGRIRFPTAAVACIRSAASWSELSRAGGELAWLVTPKLLSRAGIS